ncbi:hypothetical protein Q5692_37795 [Microcoleus sp. C2C3]|uniref:hypothetical protein n=1 Tax=unclassified Microcoleus TaxID=2642155 RepID=UPI002FCFA7AA
MPHDHPRLELLKQQASQMGLTRDQIREFGSLSRRATWESAISLRQATNRELDQWNELESVDNVIHSPPSEAHDTRTLNLLSFPQLVTLFVLTVGFFVLIAPVLRGANLLPIKITIQIGAKQ